MTACKRQEKAKSRMTSRLSGLENRVDDDAPGIKGQRRWGFRGVLQMQGWKTSLLGNLLAIWTTTWKTTSNRQFALQV